MKLSLRALLIAAILPATAVLALAHGDVTPQAVDVSTLEPVGADWLAENPYRSKPGQLEAAVKVGASGYNQNCARCHGLEAISGGLAPDLRYLDAGKEGDGWYLERVRAGYTQNGVTKMPKFEGLFSQEAMWAIRSYIESRPQD